MTLRELVWMANSKREHSYDVASATILYFQAMWNGDRQALKNNPYRGADTPKTLEQEKEEAKDGWTWFKTGLKHIAGR